MQLDGSRYYTFRLCFPHCHNLDDPSTKGCGEIEFQKWLMFGISTPKSMFFDTELEQVMYTFPKLDFRMLKMKVTHFPIWDISNLKSSILQRIRLGKWHLPKGVRRLSTSSAWDPAWSLPESDFIPLDSIFLENVSVVGGKRIPLNFDVWCFETQLTVFCKGI